MQDVVQDWCKKWHMGVNVNKSNFTPFRTKSNVQTDLILL